MEDFQVKDGERAITFTGDLLASVTSYAPEKQRWIELDLYRTKAGTYVLAGCGRSLVDGETDRRWVQLADEPDGVIERLYLYSDEGARYIPNTSRELITLAGANDKALYEAFMTEHVA